MEPFPEVRAFEAALLSGDLRTAAGLLEACIADGRGLVAAELGIVQPALYAIGEKWRCNQVSVAQEHLATAIAQAAMTLALAKSAPPRPNGRRVLLACVAGNRHTVGLQMVSDAFVLSGWEVQYLGADVPAQALVRQAASWRPDLLGLSVSFSSQVDEARHVIASLRDALEGKALPVIVGGLAVDDGLAAAAGAQGWAPDSRAAVRTGESLAGAA